MVPLEKLGTVSYLHPIASMAIYLAVLTQYANVTDRQRPSLTDIAQPSAYAVARKKI